MCQSPFVLKDRIFTQSVAGLELEFAACVQAVSEITVLRFNFNSISRLLPTSFHSGLF